MRTPSHGPVTPAPEELAPLFPQLEIIELLGRGGMGAVYRATDTVLDRQVALKVLPPDMALDPEAVPRFYQEGRDGCGAISTCLQRLVLFTEGDKWLAQARSVGTFALGLSGRKAKGEKKAKVCESSRLLGTKVSLRAKISAKVSQGSKVWAKVF